MTMDGTVERIGEGFKLRFERRLPYPVDAVWAAITDADKVSVWLGGEGSQIELRPGGRVYMTGKPAGIPNDAVVLAVDPPRLLEYEWKTQEWDAGILRWELSPDAGGTVLVFTHHELVVDQELERRLAKEYGWGPEMLDPIPRTLAGWHSLLDGLENLLDPDSPPLPEDRWMGIHQHYREQLPAER